MADTTDPATVVPGTPDHPTLGRHIATRGQSALYAVVGLVILGIAAAVLLGLIGAVSDAFAKPPPTVPRGSFLNHAIPIVVLLAILAGLIWGAWAVGRITFDRFRFFERGLSVTRFGAERRTLAYIDTSRLLFTVTRQYINGIYAGTALAVKLTDTAGRKLSFSGRYKEKSKGFGFTILHKKFEGEDEMDVVKLIIAESVADRMVEQMERDGSVEWAAKVRLSPGGVTAPSGKRKRQEVAYEKIVSVLPKDGFLHLFHEGDEKSFVGVPFNAENSWPGFVVWQRMMQVAHQPTQGGASAG